MNPASVRLTRLLPADIERVFAAWSEAEALSRWFVVEPGWTATASNDFRVGGTYRVEMRRGDGSVFLCWGEYVEIDPPRRLVFTWNSAAPAIRGSRVTIELASVGSSTELTLLHERLPDTAEGRAHAAGWEGSLTSLGRFLAGHETGARPGEEPP